MYTTAIIYTCIAIAGVVGSITYSMYKPQIKGFLGERSVNNTLKKLSKKGQGKLLKNINLLKKDGQSTQIDQIYINRSGIFVIETKNYSGELIGKETDKKWTQKIGDKTFPANNFARQNAGHIEALRPILSKYPSLPIYSVVCFNPSCDTKLSLTKTILTNYNTISNAIKIRSRRTFISENELDELQKAIKQESGRNQSVEKTHVARVKLQRSYDKRAMQQGLSREEYDIETAKRLERLSNVSIDLSDTNKDINEIINNASKRTQQTYERNQPQKNNFERNYKTWR